MTTGDAIVLGAYVIGLVIAATSAVGMLYASRSSRLGYVGAVVLTALSIFLLVQLLAIQRAVLPAANAKSARLIQVR